MKNTLLLLLLFEFGKPLLGQSTLSGKIISYETEEEIEAAKIVICNTDQSNAQNPIILYTDSAGYYQSSLCPGTYSIEVSYGAFPNNRINGISMIDREDQQVDLTLNYPDTFDWYFYPHSNGYFLPEETETSLSVDSTFTLDELDTVASRKKHSQLLPLKITDHHLH